MNTRFNTISKGIEQRIWAIGGGKGGVGKSFITANLAMLLAQQKKRVVAIDVDLGGANLHSFLGVKTPQKTLSDFLEKEVVSLEEVVVPTAEKNLGLISGAQDSIHAANLSYAHKLRLLHGLKKLDAEYILLDLGAGTTFNTLDFFTFAHTHVIVVTPEPTSIENAYRFIKSAFYRRLRQNGPDSYIRSIVDQVMHPKNEMGIRTPKALVDYLGTLDPSYQLFVEQELKLFRPQLIFNQIRSEGDVRLSQAMADACLRHFGIHLEFLGYLPHHLHVEQSVTLRQPFLLEFAQSPLVPRLRHLCKKLIND